MSGVIRWEDPPEPTPSGVRRGAHMKSRTAVAAELRAVPGRWGVVDEYDNAGEAGRLARVIREGTGAWWGGFEAVARQPNGIPTVYARYVGEAK